jgi:hypothetical protein
MSTLARQLFRTYLERSAITANQETPVRSIQPAESVFATFPSLPDYASAGQQSWPARPGHDVLAAMGPIMLPASFAEGTHHITPR